MVDPVTHQQAIDNYKNKLQVEDKREIGNEAVWSLSTAKPGNGVEQLRDDNVDTFWQSDGPQPHLINVQFHKKTRIKEIAVYTDFKLDESYTPSIISIRAGTAAHDLQEIQLLELEEPSGWISIPLVTSPDGADGSSGQSNDGCIRAHMIQIAVLASHQNGRDTHIRQAKIFGQRQAETKGMGTELSQFSTVDFQQFASIR